MVRRDAALAKLNGGQLAKTFQVQVSDTDGHSIAGVTVTPWALRSSQGHGPWEDEDDHAEMPPEPATTGEDGIATIRYPFYRNVNEQTRTFSVSVNVTHPDFTMDDAVHIDVPLLDDGALKIEMERAASIVLIPKSNAADFHIDQIYLVSSDPTSWPSHPLKRQSDRVVLETLSPGSFRAMLVRIVNGRSVEFSDPVELSLESGINDSIDVPMHPATDPYCRPQVFPPQTDQTIVVAMKPLLRCDVAVTGPDDQPLGGIRIAASPSVGWWNWGSQVYGRPLMQSTEIVCDGLQYDWQSDTVRGYDDSFSGTSGIDGNVTLHLPAGDESVVADSEDYQLPVFMGRRRQQINVAEGTSTNFTLKLEPVGTETLGEYDKLAGIVFGCSTREGKQICALPEVRQKMDEFAQRLREADDPRDPAVLAEAFAVVAEAFERAGDSAEAAKWRGKADAEKAKL